MNDREFDAFLRETLRLPAPSQVPDEVRSNEIARTLSAVFDDAVWDDGVDDVNDDDDRRDGDDRQGDLKGWEEGDADDEWDDVDDDPLLSSDPLDDDAGHPDGHGDGDTFGPHGPGLGHESSGTHDDGHHGLHGSGTDHDSFGHQIGPAEHGLDEI